MNKPLFPDIPDMYVDRMRMTVTVFGVNFTFGLGAPHPEEQKTGEILDLLELVRLRMSLEHAKVLAMMIRRQIKIYEAGTQTEVAIPKPVLDALELSDQVW